MPDGVSAPGKLPLSFDADPLEAGDFGEAIPVKAGIPQGDFRGLCPFHEESDINFVRHADPSCARA